MAVRAERFEADHFSIDVGRFDVEVHAILGCLRLSHCLQQQLRRPTLGGDEHHVVAGVTRRRVAERL